MSFRIGQRVYLGYPDPKRAMREALKYACSIGEISAGPFRGGDFVPGYRHPCACRSWIVDVDSAPVLAAEYLLQPIDDDPESETDERRQEIVA